MRSIDCYDLLAPYFDFEGFLTLATKHKLPATKIWLRCSRENSLDSAYAPPYKGSPSGRWDTQGNWENSFIERFQSRLTRLVQAGITPMLTYVDGASWNTKTWAKHPWKRSNNIGSRGTDDFATSREAGPDGDGKDERFMELFWYPLVSRVASLLPEPVWDALIHVPTSEPRQTWHPTRFMVRYLHEEWCVPRSRIMLSGNGTAEWDAFKASDDLKRNIGIFSVHGVRDLKTAKAELGDLPARYPNIEWRPDSDGARVPQTNDYLSRAGLDGRMTGMRPAWWKGVLEAYPNAGLLLGLWGFGHPNISKLKPNEWPKYWAAAEPLFRL